MELTSTYFEVVYIILQYRRNKLFLCDVLLTRLGILAAVLRVLQFSLKSFYLMAPNNQKHKILHGNLGKEKERIKGHCQAQLQAFYNLA